MMSGLFLYPRSLFFHLVLPLFFFFISISIAAQSDNSNNPNCPSSKCGDINISYPFRKIGREPPITTQFCGYEGFGINCSTINRVDRAIIELDGEPYFIRNITYEHSAILLIDYDVSPVVLPSGCPRVRHNISLETLPLNFSSYNVNISFHFNCTASPPAFATEIPCLGYDDDIEKRKSYVNLVDSETDNFDWDCDEEVVTTVIEEVFNGLGPNVSNYYGVALSRGFELLWGKMENCEKCEESDGRCGHNYNTTEFMCFCPDYTVTKEHCKGDESGRVISFFDDQLKSLECESVIKVPVSREVFDEFKRSETMPLEEVFIQGFQMDYRVDGAAICSRCETSGGTCWSGLNSSVPSCLCPGGIPRSVCPPSGPKPNLKVKVIIGVLSGVFGVFLMCVVFYFWRRRNNKKRYYGSSYTSRNINSSYTSSVTDPEKNGTYLGVQIFKYRELEKATNHFDSANELGDGGFGTVYQGKLKDGRVVAVKRLYENNYKRVEQFMNEVGILAHLRHQNLVSLYGCTTHHSRELLLVYEFIPNGTVADHLHGEKSNPGSLSWTTRMSIAIETASALVYLHASEVVHRDVKTNNILLDNSFTVKVADFGLSRLFPNNVTHVSTAPQGTPGYVDPEYHECYQLTSKSDVYSFGVVLIELISSKPAVDITRHRHEINLSNMALNKIRNDALHELVDPNLGFETDYEVRKMINAVAELAFQCLQNERDCRPSMDEVLEALIGIQNGSYNKVKKDVHDDDTGLLKNHSQTMSPDSVAIAWSTSTLSTSSG